MPLFDKTGDITEFNWNKKIGDLVADKADLTPEQLVTSDGNTGNQSLLPDNQVPQKNLTKKLDDITEFNWNKKIGDLVADKADLTPEQLVTSDGKTGNQSLLSDNQIPQKSLAKKFDEEIDYDNMGPDGLSINDLRGDNNFGFDHPFVLKKIGDEFPKGIFVDNGIAAQVLQSVDHLQRITKATLTPRGILWNIKQLVLQRQNSMPDTRGKITTPLASTLGSAVHTPLGPVRLSRMDNDFNPFNEPKKYGDDSSGWDVKDDTKLKRIYDDQVSFNTPNQDTGTGVFNNIKNFLKDSLNGDRDAFQNPQPDLRNQTGIYAAQQVINNPSSFETGIGNSNVLSKASNTDNSSKFLPGSTGKIKGAGRENRLQDTSLYSIGSSNQLQVSYGGTYGEIKARNLPKDFIKFRIRDAVNGKWLIFPAHLGSVTDTVSPEYTQERYIGRPDAVHIYSGTNRAVSFDFKVAAFTKQEIPIIQEKMNYLVGLAYPTFKPLSDDTEMRPVTPYVYLTIGDMFNNTPGYFSSITLTVEENAVWELDDGYQIPQFFNVSCEFTYIGKYLPQTIGKHYEVPHLKDSGVGVDKFGTFGNKDPKAKANLRPSVTSGVMSKPVMERFHDKK